VVTVLLQEPLDDKDSLQKLIDELEVKLEAVVELEEFDEADILKNEHFL